MSPIAIGIGIAVSVVASAINFATALTLMKVGRQHNSITLEANGHHLLTDVWTSAGVLVAVGLVALTNWNWLDPLVSVFIGLLIFWNAWGILRETVGDLSLRKIVGNVIRTALLLSSADNPVKSIAVPDSASAFEAASWVSAPSKSSERTFAPRFSMSRTR